MAFSAHSNFYPTWPVIFGVGEFVPLLWTFGLLGCCLAVAVAARKELADGFTHLIVVTDVQLLNKHLDPVVVEIHLVLFCARGVQAVQHLVDLFRMASKLSSAAYMSR